SRALPDDMVAEMQRGCIIREQSAEPLLALDQRTGTKILAVDVEKIEQKKYQRRRIAAVGSELNDVEGGDAVGTNAAQFAIQIGLSRAERGHGFGDRPVFVRPVEAGAGQQFHRAAVEPCMHAVSVVLDFMQPAVAVRRRIDEL